MAINLIKCLSGSHKNDFAVVNTIRENTYQTIGYFRETQEKEAREYFEKWKEIKEKEKEE